MQPYANLDKRVINNKWLGYKFDRDRAIERREAEKAKKEAEKAKSNT